MSSAWIATIFIVAAADFAVAYFLGHEHGRILERKRCGRIVVEESQHPHGDQGLAALDLVRWEIVGGRP